MRYCRIPVKKPQALLLHHWLAACWHPSQPVINDPHHTSSLSSKKEIVRSAPPMFPSRAAQHAACLFVGSFGSFRGCMGGCEAHSLRTGAQVRRLAHRSRPLTGWQALADWSSFPLQILQPDSARSACAHLTQPLTKHSRGGTVSAEIKKVRKKLGAPVSRYDAGRVGLGCA